MMRKNNSVSAVIGSRRTDVRLNRQRKPGFSFDFDACSGRRQNRNIGVSAVIGVILMVAIVVSIAATVYYYVTTVMEDQVMVMEARGVFLGMVNDNGSCDLLFQNSNGTGFTLHDMKNIDLFDNNFIQGFIGRSVICRYEFNTMNGDKFLGMFLDSDYL